MRHQYKPKAKKQNLMPLYILASLTAVMLIVMTVALCIPVEPPMGDFVPPGFDTASEIGTPEVPEGLGYSSPYREGMAYRFSVCGNVRMEGSAAIVYLTSDAENEVYLKLRVLDGQGNILGETGLIKPGEYVKSVALTEPLAPGTAVRLKIMSYEPETYMSAGSASLNTKIGG